MAAETQAVEAVTAITAQPQDRVSDDARQTLSTVLASLADEGQRTRFGLVERTAYTAADQQAGNALLPLAIIRGNNGNEYILFTDNSDGGDHSVNREVLDRILRQTGNAELIPEEQRQNREDIEAAIRKYATGNFQEATQAAAFLHSMGRTNFTFGNVEYRISSRNLDRATGHITFGRTLHVESRNIGQQNWQRDSIFHQYRDTSRGFALPHGITSFRTRAGEARLGAASQTIAAPENVFSYRHTPVVAAEVLPNLEIADVTPRRTDERHEEVVPQEPVISSNPADLLARMRREIVTPQEVVTPQEIVTTRAEPWTLHDFAPTSLNPGPYTSEDRRMEEVFSAFYRRNVFALFTGRPEGQQVNSMTVQDVRQWMTRERGERDRNLVMAGWELESSHIFDRVAALHDDGDGGRVITPADIRAGKRQTEERRLAADPDFQFVRDLFREVTLPNGERQNSFDLLMQNPRVRRTGQITYEALEQTIQGMNANDPRKQFLTTLQNRWYWLNSSGFSKYLQENPQATNSMLSSHLNYFLTAESLARGFNLGINQGENALSVLRERAATVPNRVEEQKRHDNIYSLRDNNDFHTFRSLFSEQLNGTSVFNRLLDKAAQNGHDGRITLADVEGLEKELDERQHGKQRAALRELARRWRAGSTLAFNNFSNFLEARTASTSWYDFSPTSYYITPASMARGLGVYVSPGQEPLAALADRNRAVYRRIEW